MPPAPVWLLYIKYAILGLAVVVLALSAYACSFFGGGAAGFLIFIVSATQGIAPLATRSAALGNHG